MFDSTYNIQLENITSKREFVLLGRLIQGGHQVTGDAQIQTDFDAVRPIRDVH
jgi:hypothetical protein